jgi:hypothetical protein
MSKPLKAQLGFANTGGRFFRTSYTDSPSVFLVYSRRFSLLISQQFIDVLDSFQDLKIAS